MADDPKDPPATGDDPPKPDLGDSGKKALDEERKARRDAERQAKDLADRLKAIEDQGKSEVERLTEQVAGLTKERDQAVTRADRYEVALEKGLDMVRAKRLTGTTREELEADADELQLWSPGGKADGPAPTKPTEDLRGGGDPETGPDPDVRAVVDSISRGF